MIAFSINSLLSLSIASFRIKSSSGLNSSATSAQCHDNLLDVSRFQNTIASGRVYQHFNFLTEEQVQYLLDDIDRLKQENIMVPSGLSNTNRGKNQNFNERDRTTAPAPWWADSLRSANTSSDDYSFSDHYDDMLASISNKIQSLRGEISSTLHRPTMMENTHGHECYYSQSRSGASLARHLDERHEETKGPRGWMLPSRRSISWLIYLSDDMEWDVTLNGGALRSFPQKGFVDQAKVGEIESGCHNGNLQVGWIHSQKEAGITMPVFLDSWFQPQIEGAEAMGPRCILYTIQPKGKKGEGDAIQYITYPWDNDVVSLTTSEFLKMQAMEDSKMADNGQHPALFQTIEFSKGFQLIEDRERWEQGKTPEGSFKEDIAPQRGSLVMFDSVTLPHEVMPVKVGTRAALAGWFHEETQPFPL